MLTSDLDCRFVVLRVHLLGHYELPILVLGSWACPRLDPDCCRGIAGAIHFSRVMVSPDAGLKRGKHQLTYATGSSAFAIQKSRMSVT